MRLIGEKDSVPFEKIIDYHICTEEDFIKFPEQAKGVSKNLTQERELFCIDQDYLKNELRLYG